MTDASDRELGRQIGAIEAAVNILREDVKKILDRIDRMPCEIRGRQIVSLRAQLRFQWAALAILVACLGYIIFGR